ncbi:Hypothetical predicted protein, partial [Paramuricea clavata]
MAETSDQDMTEGQTAQTSSSSSSLPTSTADQCKYVSYVDLLEYCIPGGFFVVTADKMIRNKVNESLSK